MSRQLDVNLHDTSIGIWQDNPDDPSFRTEIYLGLQQHLRRRGWTLRADPRILKNYRCLSKDHRIASRGDLKAEVRLSGRVVEVMFWAETWPIDNRNGRRYDFHKRDRMCFLDQVRFDLETRKVLDWLRDRADVTVIHRDHTVRIRPGALDAMAAINRDYASSWHSDKTLGRPVCSQSCNSKSGDGATVEHGATVWFADGKGRLCRGVAYYNINNMWWVVTNRYGRTNKGSHELFTRPPADLRRKRNERVRRLRLEQELAAAIRRSDFRRAELLKRIAFGEAATYGIWSVKEQAFYRPNRSGYTTDTIAAGRYSWAEAAREVRLGPDILRLVTPDGAFVDAASLDLKRAA